MTASAPDIILALCLFIDTSIAIITSHKKTHFCNPRLITSLYTNLEIKVSVESTTMFVYLCSFLIILTFTVICPVEVNEFFSFWRIITKEKLYDNEISPFKCNPHN